MWGYSADSATMCHLCQILVTNENRPKINFKIVKNDYRKNYSLTIVYPSIQPLIKKLNIQNLIDASFHLQSSTILMMMIICFMIMMISPINSMYTFIVP